MGEFCATPVAGIGPPTPVHAHKCVKPAVVEFKPLVSVASEEELIVFVVLCFDRVTV